MVRAFTSRPALAIAISASAIALCIGAAHSAFAFESYYANRFSPGVFIGPLDMSGKTKDDARSLLSDFEETLEDKGVQIAFQGVNAIIYPTPIPLASDIPIDTVHPLAAIHIEDTISASFAVGHTENVFADFAQHTFGRWKKIVIPVAAATDHAALQESIREEFSEFIVVAVQPHFTATDGTVSVTEGVEGQEFDYEKVSQEVTNELEYLRLPTVQMVRRTIPPTLDNAVLYELKTKVLPLLETAPTTLTLNEEQIPLLQSDVVTWITPRKQSDSTYTLEFNAEAIRSYLTGTISPQIAIQPEAPHFTLEDGVIRASAGPVTGRALDIEATQLSLLSAINSRAPSVALVTQELPSPLTEVANGLHVKEVVASAETNFQGSPTNRRKNIALGMSRINGLVVMPDEEFSLIKALGPIEKENGFLPELVIKGNKTTPEYGGGLCQVSTTLFRAVAHAGLPVLERRNHSYRVSYYEPPVGFDATIYFPKPDFRFSNDTGAPVLIIASVKGTIAQVTLWGTRDGRAVEVDTPRVYNIKKAGTPKIVETDTLKPGEKKCTEKAHNGADAVFERRVTHANGEQTIDTFVSHYVVWPAVCLVGKQPITEASEEKNTETSSAAEGVLEQTSASTTINQ